MVHKDDLNFRSITKKENKNQYHVLSENKDRFIEISKPYNVRDHFNFYDL
jgi:hypothetical protein